MAGPTQPDILSPAVDPKLLASSPRATKAGQAPRSQSTFQRAVNAWGGTPGPRTDSICSAPFLYP